MLAGDIAGYVTAHVVSRNEKETSQNSKIKE